jgi:hypothetical protein
VVFGAEAGAVPTRLTWHNESGIGRGKRTEPASAFAGTLCTSLKGNGYRLKQHQPAATAAP